MTKPFCLTCASISSTQSLITSGLTGSLASFSTRLDIHASLQSVARTIVRRAPRVQDAVLHTVARAEISPIGERDAIARTADAHLLLIVHREPDVVCLGDHAVAFDACGRHDDAQHAHIGRLLREHAPGERL